MSEFQDFRYPLAFQERKDSSGPTNEDFNFGPVPPGHLWVITNIAAENETANAGSIRVSMTGYGLDHLLVGLEEVENEIIYSFENTYYIPEGRTLRVRMLGTHSADAVTVSVNGFDVIQPEGAKHA